MKRRILALLLALVLMLSMLPTAFALDAAEAPDTEHPTQGETEEVEEVGVPEEFESFEEPEDAEEFDESEGPENFGEPEDPEEFEESEASEAMAAEFAAVAVNGIEPDAYLMGVHLKNGYYTVDDKYDLRYSADKPDGWNKRTSNSLSYQDGVLTVEGPTTLKNNGGEGWDAVLSVRSGVLSIVCSGTLMLRGTGMTALSSDGDVLINGSVTIESIDACAVRGNLSIVNAKNVTITASASKTASNKASCDTIDGDAYIEAGGSITLKNMLSGACVNGSLRAQGHSLAINNSSADKPALTSDRDHILTADTLTLHNSNGPAAQGGLYINVYSENANITGRYNIYGASPNGEPVVRGSVYAKGGRLYLTNSGSGKSKNKTVGPVLAGNLTLENGTGLNVEYKLSSSSQMSGAVIQGDVELINCRINRETENSFRITRRYGEGPAVDGDITLRNSQLYIDAKQSKASGGETPSVQNCVLSLQNSHFTVRGSGSWKDVWLDEDYRWYAGDDTPNVPFYKDGCEEPLRAEALTKAAYVDIYTGDKVGDATMHDASFTESKTIDGFASWPMPFDVTVQMTGDTLDLQKVDGYKELYDSYEKGEKITHYGVDSSVDLTAYFQINNTAGDDWKITAADYLEQGATELRLRISGAPFQVCDKLFSMTIRGRILSGGHDLAVTGSNEIYWNIRLMPPGELDYDNIRTAAEFAEAVGGADYAVASDSSSWVLLMQDVYLPQDITMTGNFSINLQGHKICSASHSGTEHLISEKETKIITDSQQKGCVAANILVTGGTLRLDNMNAGDIRVESGSLELDYVSAGAVVIDGGFADLKSAALKSIIMADGELQWYNDVYQTDVPCLFSICGGKAEIQENSNFYGMMDVSGGEVNISNSMVYGYEEMWLSQTGGTVNVRNSELHNAAMLGGGELYINGSTLQSDFSGTDCLYLGGGEAVVTNTKVLANPTEPESGEESRIIHSSVHMDGGRLTLDNSPLFGSLVINAGAALELKNGSNVKTEAAMAIMASGEVHITDCDVRGKQIGLLVTGGKKASAMLHSGEVSGKEAGVLVDGGSFTMDGGTIYGAQCGIHVGGTPKSTVKISGGEINADDTALFAKQGSSVSLSGGTFTAGQNALAAGESTMKGWLAKGYDMIGADLPGGFDPAKESGTGAGTVTIAAEDGEDAAFVTELIDEIGKVELTDECERKILDAEEAYEMLTAAQQKKVTNYKTLLKARQTYDKQVAEREYAEQAGYVNYLMEEIPADMEKIESSTLSVIREAEEAYNEAAKDKNVKKYLDNDLVKRLKTARKTYDKNEKAAGKVQELIDDLPAPEELTYAKDRKSVAKAQTAFENLTAAQQTFLGDGTDRRLTACVRQMALLTDCETIVKDAQAAIKKLPAWNKIKKSDEAKVHAAEEAMQALASAAEEKHVTLTPGEANEQKYQASTEAFYAYKELAESYRKTYLAPLETLTDADEAHEAAIRTARTEYQALGKSYNGSNVSKCVQSFIEPDDLTMLKNLEKQLSQNQKAAKKVTSLISKLPKHDAPFTKKERKAIDTAKSAYDGLSSAARSFVENVDTLNERYQQAYPTQDSGEQA
ncbi:MAG: hypothetical protein ACLT8T_02470 [Oscillospiraceae bacterium]